jgi:hypothetical protein
LDWLIGGHFCPNPVRKREFFVHVYQFNLCQHDAVQNALIDIDVPRVAGM